MWRPAHGATSRPGPCRPASGYGRAPGRPGPSVDRLVDDPAPPVTSLLALIGADEPATPADLAELAEATEETPTDAGREVDAPVTP